MDEKAARAAADLIWEAWCNGEILAGLPDGLKPQTRTEGYEVQSRLAQQPGNELAGWKIAATSAAGQNHICVDGPIAGRLFANRIVSPGATVSIRNNRMRVCEPEFAFRMGQDVLPCETEYSVDEVMELVSDLHLALELPDSRFASFAEVGGPTLIADNACTDWLVTGPAVTADWRSIDLSKHTVTGHVAARTEREGSGANVLGDPRVALTWLVNELSALGLTLGAGHLVTTGTSMVPLDIVEGDDIMADFGAFGQIQVYVAA